MSLLPGQYIVTDQRLEGFVRRQIFPLLTISTSAATTPVAITESIRETSVPYYVVLGMFAKRHFAVFVDEMAQHCFEVPVIAEKAYFSGMTIFAGELTWEYKLINGITQPRQVFFVSCVFRVAGKIIDPNTCPWVDRYAMIRSLFDTLDKDICLKPRSWPDEARVLANQHKIVALATLNCLTFRPKHFFPLTELDLMRRTYIPTFRWLWDDYFRISDEKAMTSEVFQGISTASPRCYFLVELDRGLGSHEFWTWTMFCRNAALEKVDVGLVGFNQKPCILMPNEIILKWATFATRLSVIVLCQLTSQLDCIECEPLHIRSERQLPDTQVFIQHLLSAAPSVQ